jgi:hypothetical protein
MAEATLGSAKMAWKAYRDDYAASATISKRCSTTFTTTTPAWPSRAASIWVASREREWDASGKAQFVPHRSSWIRRSAAPAPYGERLMV